MTTISKPDCCPICGYYLTMAAEFTGQRCVDPAHWQAAGVLAPRDYYPMAKIVSAASVELNQRSTQKDILNLSFNGQKLMLI